MVFSAAGNIEHEFLVEQVERCFSSLRKKNLLPFNRPCTKEEYRQLKDLEQVHLVLGFKGFLIIMRIIIPFQSFQPCWAVACLQGFFKKFVRKEVWFYTIYSSVESYLDDGKILIYAGTTNKMLKVDACDLRTIKRITTNINNRRD